MMRRVFAVSLSLLLAGALAGCGQKAMVNHNRASAFYTLDQLQAQYTWLSDVADSWRTTVDLDAARHPTYGDLGAYPLGNGEIFGINGLVAPLGTVVNIIGPGYQKESGFHGACVPAVAVDGELRYLPKQSVEWVRQAGIVHSVQRDDEMALHVYDWVAPTGGLWYRLALVESLGVGPLRNVELIMAVNSPPDEVVPGRIRTIRGHSQLTLGVAGKAAAKPSGFHPPLRDDAPDEQLLANVEGMSHLLCPIGTIEKGKSGGKLFFVVLQAMESESKADEIARQLETDNLSGLVEAYENNSTWHKKGLMLGTPDHRINDFVEIQKHIVRVQQAAQGGFSPMDKYTFTWIRDSVGSVRFFLQAGYDAEVKKYLEYQYMGNARSGSISLNLGLCIEPGDNPEPDWSEAPVDRAEVPSYIVLHHYWYYRQTGDAELIEKHWDYLRRCIFGQQISERGTLHFHGDETYRFPGYMGFRAGLEVPDYVQLDAQSADTAFLFVAAADAMTEMAGKLGYGDQVGEFRAISDRIRSATERYYWMADRGYYAPAMSDFTDEVHRYPFASINLRPIWIGYARPDDRQRSNVVNSLKYLWRPGGKLWPTPGFGYYTTMMWGFLTYNLAELDHPMLMLALTNLMDAAEPSGGFAEMNTPEDRPAETVWGQHRCRPWEGGINAHAVVHALLGPRVDAEANRISLTPRLAPDWQVFGAANIPVGDNRLDLQVHGSRGKRIYELTAQPSDNPPTVDLYVKVPAIRVSRVEGDFSDYGGRVAGRDYEQGTTTVHIADIKMPQEGTVAVEVSFEYEEPPVISMRTETFHYGPAKVTGNPDTLLLTWNPVTYDHYHQEFGGRLMAVDTKIPWPLEYLRGLLLPSPGKLGFQNVLLDVETYPGAFRPRAFWTDGPCGQLLKEFEALGGTVEKAEATTDLPPSYLNLPREHG
jgi:hypothetical protein